MLFCEIRGQLWRRYVSIVSSVGWYCVHIVASISSLTTKLNWRTKCMYLYVNLTLGDTAIIMSFTRRFIESRNILHHLHGALNLHMYVHESIYTRYRQKNYIQTRMKKTSKLMFFLNNISIIRKWIFLIHSKFNLTLRLQSFFYSPPAIWIFFVQPNFFTFL